MSKEIKLSPASAAVLFALSLTVGAELNQLASASMPALVVNPRTGQPRGFPGLADGIRHDAPIRVESLAANHSSNLMPAVYLAIAHNALLTLIDDLGPDGAKQMILSHDARETVLGVTKKSFISAVEQSDTVEGSSTSSILAIMMAGASGLISVEEKLQADANATTQAVFPPPEGLGQRARSEARLLIIEIDTAISELLK